MGHCEFIFPSSLYEWRRNQSRLSSACPCGGTGEGGAGCYDRFGWRELCFLGRERGLYEPVEYKYEKGKRTPGKISALCKRLCKKEWIQRNIFYRTKTL